MCTGRQGPDILWLQHHADTRPSYAGDLRAGARLWAAEHKLTSRDGGGGGPLQVRSFIVYRIRFCFPACDLPSEHLARAPPLYTRSFIN